MTFLLQERCCLAQFSVISVAAQLRTQLPVIQSSEKSQWANEKKLDYWVIALNIVFWLLLFKKNANIRWQLCHFPL